MNCIGVSMKDFCSKPQKIPSMDELSLYPREGFLQKTAKIPNMAELTRCLCEGFLQVTAYVCKAAVSVLCPESLPPSRSSIKKILRTTVPFA